MNKKDIEKCNNILKECKEVEIIIKEQNNILKEKEKEIKALLPKGYWWTYDIDTSWNKAKKYHIKEVSVCDGELYITVKEVLKSKHLYSLDRFIKLNISKTEEEANIAHYNRICPKCGCVMKHACTIWCEKCMDERSKKARQFRENHRFYSPEKNGVYTVGYTDELTKFKDKGYNGKHFTIQRMDTMEIIETDNLWSSYPSNYDSLPQIKFLND